MYKLFDFNILIVRGDISRETNGPNTISQYPCNGFSRDSDFSRDIFSLADIKFKIRSFDYYL